MAGFTDYHCGEHGAWQSRRHRFQPDRRGIYLCRDLQGLGVSGFRHYGPGPRLPIALEPMALRRVAGAPNGAGWLPVRRLGAGFSRPPPGQGRGACPPFRRRVAIPVCQTHGKAETGRSSNLPSAAITTLWRRPSTHSSRPRSSTVADRGAPSRSSTMPRCYGWTVSTTAGCAPIGSIIPAEAEADPHETLEAADMAASLTQTSPRSSKACGGP